MDTTTSTVAQAASRSPSGRSSSITGSNAPNALRPATSRRSASIGEVNRTRGIGPPQPPEDFGLSTPATSALAIAARVALHAALLEDEGLAALRALGVQAFPQQLRGVARLLLHLDIRLDGAAELVVGLDGR